MMRNVEKTSTLQTYQIPLIATDLRQEELIHQIADSLQYLHHVMDDVFAKVQTRVAENKARLAKVNERTQLAQAKVDHLRGRRKATQVYLIIIVNSILCYVILCEWKHLQYVHLIYFITNLYEMIFNLLNSSFLDVDIFKFKIPSLH